MPIWVDNNILVYIDQGRTGREAARGAALEADLANLQRSGTEVLITKNVEHEFLNGQGFRPQDTVRRQALLNNLGIRVDTMANQVPRQQIWAWREEGIQHGLSIPDADVVAQVRASGQARGITNPVLVTKDAGGTLAVMRRRGVMAVDRVPAPAALPPAPPPSTPPAPKPPAPPSGPSTPKPPKPPKPGVFRARLNTAKLALKEGLKGAFSPEGLASMLPEIVLALADRAATKEAIRTIQLKFLKEGFAKGVAAGAMGWSEQEVEQELRHGVTNYRVKGMEDPAGTLTRAYMLQLAQVYEDYGVDVGFEYSRAKTLAWKKNMLAKGMAALVEYNWHFPDDPDALFRFDFLQKLSWAMKDATNAIVEPMIRSN